MCASRVRRKCLDFRAEPLLRLLVPLPRIVCITLWGTYEASRGATVRTPEIARASLSEYGIEPAFFYGLNGGALGLDARFPYGVPPRDPDYKLDPKYIGVWLSHRALWSALLLLPDDMVLVLEDDACFPDDWRVRVEKAIEDAGDFDILFVGACCTFDKPKTLIAGNVYEVRWPMCLHAYVVRRRALETLIATQDSIGCRYNIDESLVFFTFDKLKAYTVLPSIIGQREMDLVP